MAKYKYNVYEVADYYSTKTISGTERTEIFSEYTKQIVVSKFYSVDGTFGYIRVDVANSKGYYYTIGNDDYQILEGVFSPGGSRGYGHLKLIKIQITKGKTRGNLIESIVAEENTYPTNGIKDGKWYVRKEKIAEIKAKFNNETLTKAYYKDSQNVVRKLSKAYFKDSNGNIKRLI